MTNKFDINNTFDPDNENQSPKVSKEVATKLPTPAKGVDHYLRRTDTDPKGEEERVKPSCTNSAYSKACPPTNTAPIKKVIMNQSLKRSLSPRSAANTPS